MVACAAEGSTAPAGSEAKPLHMRLKTSMSLDADAAPDQEGAERAARGRASASVTQIIFLRIIGVDRRRGRGCRAPPRRLSSWVVTPMGSATRSATNQITAKRTRPRRRSCLFELDQRAGEVLGVEEEHRLAVGADLRAAVAEHARALGEQAVAGGGDVGRPRSRGGGCRRRGSSPGRRRWARPRPSGCRSSILVLGSSTKTTVTPWPARPAAGRPGRRGCRGTAPRRRRGRARRWRRG